MVKLSEKIVQEKKAVMIRTLILLLIAVVGLVLMVIVYFLAQNTGKGVLEYIFDLFRFGFGG